MSQVVVAALMWGFVLSGAVSAGHDSDRSMWDSSVAIAVSLSLNIDAIYVAGDRLLGGANWLELASDVLLMVGISFLLRGLLRATRGGRNPQLERGLSAILVIVCLVLAVLFLNISAPATSTVFMLSYGGQPAAAAYSITQFLSVGVATAVMAWVCFRHAKEMGTAVSRGALRMVGAGNLCALALSVLIISMDVTHATGDLPGMRALSAGYEPLYVSAIALLCIGYSVPPVVRRAETFRYRRDTTTLLDRITLVWRGTVDMDAAIPVNQYVQPDHGGVNVGNEVLLHRMIVEIRDATVKNRSALPPAADQLLRTAESHLLSPYQPAAGGAKGT